MGDEFVPRGHYTGWRCLSLSVNFRQIAGGAVFVIEVVLRSQQFAVSRASFLANSGVFFLVLDRLGSE